MGTRKTWLVGMAAVALLIVCETMLSAHAANTSPYATLEVMTPAIRRCPGPLYLLSGQPLGVPAIAPRDDCTPSFTVADVLTYAANHSFAYRRITAIGQPRVTKVLFITSKEAEQLLGHSSGLPDDALVCVLERYGFYRFATSPARGRRRFASVHTGAMDEVFDARTGNLIMSGG